MYRNPRTSEDIYSVAEAALLLGISPGEALSLIRSGKLGHSSNNYGFEVSHTDIAHYLAYGQAKSKKRRRTRRMK